MRSWQLSFLIEATLCAGGCVPTGSGYLGPIHNSGCTGHLQDASQ